MPSVEPVHPVVRVSCVIIIITIIVSFLFCYCSIRLDLSQPMMTFFFSFSFSPSFLPFLPDLLGGRGRIARVTV